MLFRAALILLAAALLRVAVEAGRGEPLFPADSAGVLPRLKEESEMAHAEEKRRSKPLAEGERIDPNRASEEELDRLPGVGPSLARAIVADREANGRFGVSE